MARVTIVFTDKEEDGCVDCRLDYDGSYKGVKDRTMAERLASACLAAVLLGEIDVDHKICKKKE